MSYDLYIWEQPAGRPQPASADDASRLVQQLQQAGLQPGPRLRALAQELQRAGDFGSVAEPDAAVMVLGLPSADRMRFMREAVDAATASGLSVFDDQLGIMFTPSGGVVPGDQAPLWQAVKQQLDAMPRPLSRGVVKDRVLQSVGGVLARHGFTPVANPRWDIEFSRSFDGGVQHAKMEFGGAGAELKCELLFVTVHDRVSAIYDEVCGRDWVQGGTENSLSVTLGEVLAESKDWMHPCATLADIDRFATTAERLALPFADECRDVKVVDRLVNQEVRYPWQQHRFAALIVAALAGNPDFERLCDKLRANHVGRAQEVVDKLEKLIAHLRQLPETSPAFR